MKLEELHIYQVAMALGEDVWKLADAWSYFIKDTIGKQLVRSADSVAQILRKVMVGIITKKI
ncbi:four helix bundle protein [Dyadobacter sp. CY356]|nr:four helix bundle protein [Dyadobacter sp. CY356]MCF0056487.1 four helix bundle protein [Dyadobacter sp. CY356]